MPLTYTVHQRLPYNLFPGRAVSRFCPCWFEACSALQSSLHSWARSKRSLLDLNVVPIDAEILSCLNYGSGEVSLDFLGFLTLPPITVASFLFACFILFFPSSTWYVGVKRFMGGFCRSVISLLPLAV